jgi:glycosyltransferase involved in cell wall biosynthesis
MDLDVLLPFHRVDSYLVEAVDSLSRSVGVSFNVILIDDRTDKSLDIFQLLAPIKNKMLLETEGGKGYGAALEIGTKYLTSDVVALFNSDDIVDPLRFKKQLASLGSSNLNFTKMQRITSQNSKATSFSGQMNSKIYNPVYLLLGAYGANASWCMRTEWWEKNSFFDDKEMLDWRIALNCFQKSSISYLPESLYFYRKHSRQVTAAKIHTQSSLIPVFDCWNRFADSLGIDNLSYEVFSALALPWLSGANLHFGETKIAAQQILNLAYDLDNEIGQDIKSLIKRRFIFSLKSKASISNKVKFAFAGSSQVINIGRDFVISALPRSFHQSSLQG